MKTCPKCSANYPDNYAVCLKDGSALTVEALPQGQANLPASSRLPSPSPTPRKAVLAVPTPAPLPQRAPPPVTGGYRPGVPLARSQERPLEPTPIPLVGEDWEPISKAGGTAWLAFYGLFLLYALVHKGPGLFIDVVFVPIHEGGHLLFRYLGETLSVLGGTFLQLFVPLALALYFRHQRQVYGTAFAAFFFFENFLNISTYMADARAQELPLVTVGDADFVMHDWFLLFSKCGLLAHDTGVAAVVRLLGWAGMLGVVFWLWKRTVK